MICKILASLSKNYSYSHRD